MDEMTPVATARSARNDAAFVAIALLVVACATPESPKPAPGAPPASVAAASQAPKPVALSASELGPGQPKAQAQKLAIESVTQLQEGDEASARHSLEKALALDPTNDIARNLMDQINADAQKELGATFFTYTVQRDDSLSKIAQQYLGDRYRFYILAKYNGIRNPSRIGAGQVIKIPGREPSAVVPPPVAAAEEPTPATESRTPRDASRVLMQQGIELQKIGDFEGAYEKFAEASKLDPGNKDAAAQRDSMRQELARRCEREAKQALVLRQNLDEAIEKWDCVLALEPSNQQAMLERAKVLYMQEQLKKKFSGK